MARDVEKRINPREIFPQARSVVVVALNYYTPTSINMIPPQEKSLVTRGETIITTY